MNRICFILFIPIVFLSCQREVITISTKANDIFYLENKGAAMRVEVDGNTASKIFLVIVHGGPGVPCMIYNTDFISQNLENQLAIVFWDQRNAGASQGGMNGKYLHLDQYVDDLRKLIELVKYRYGKDLRIYLVGHSWGGLVTSAFLTQGNNQSMVRGWICVDGSHNYPLNDTLTHNKLLAYGQWQTTLGKNTDQWKEIVQYCTAHNAPFSFDESMQMEDYATTAETLIDSVKQLDMMKLFWHYALSQKSPVTADGMNYLYSSNADLNKEISTVGFSMLLYKVTVPSLLLYGKYDFICPEGLADDILAHIGSSYVKKVISPVSGHNLMFQDGKLFVSEVVDFVNANP